MTPIQALILGIVQGLTEFLPVSSSGHLVIFQHLFNLQQPPILFDVVVHIATLIAVIFYFSSKLKKISPQLIKLTILGTVPAIIAGLIIEPYLESIFSSLFIVSLGLFFTGLILLSTKFYSPKKTSKLNHKNTLIIGLAQAMAIMPGISRSGSTVIAGLHQGIKKQQAFYFSFVLAIPAISGALVLQLKDIDTIEQLITTPYIIGFISAAISGLFALRLLEIVLNKAKLHYFSYYCFILATLIFITF